MDFGRTRSIRPFFLGAQTEEGMRNFCLLMAVMSVSCATISTESTISETKIREWKETDKSVPSVRFDSASADDKTVTGTVEEYKTCRDLSKEENVRVELNRYKPRRLWLPILSGVVAGSVGAYLLASAHNRSTKPGKDDDGDETMSPRSASYIFGGISVGGATALFGYSTGIAIRSIDKEKPLDNKIEVTDESSPYDCDVAGLANAPVEVFSTRLGIEVPVEVTRTNDAGELEFTLTNTPGFEFPTEDSETIMLTLTVGGVSAEVPVDDWVFAPFDEAKDSCKEFDSCAAKHDALRKENDRRKTKILGYVKNRLVSLAQNSEDLCRKFEKAFAGSNEFGNLDDIRDVCDFFAVQNKKAFSSIKDFLKKKRSTRTRQAAEYLAYDLIAASPTIADCRWFEEQFPQSQYLTSTRDYALSLEYGGVSAQLLKCCGSGNLKVVDVLRNEKKGWSESLAVEQVMQSSSSFRVFNSNEIEQLRHAGMRDGVVQAMMRKAGLIADELKNRQRESERNAEIEERITSRNQGDVKRCIFACDKDFRECAERYDRNILDELILDTTRCKPIRERCVELCKE
jgi:hypothetical protein